ncbi:MAG: S41 family peptidase, partial [Lysinibacillus sp.]
LQEALQKWPLTVVQNEGSASASEVLSGALKVWDIATIIGVKSFGKGTVQQSWDLQNGGQVKLSTSKWLTPAEQWIHKKGIEPHIDVEQHAVFGLEKIQLLETYNVGDYHSDISFVQRALFALGYTVGEVNGYYGEQLKQSVLQFKEQHEAGNGEQLDPVFYEALHQEIIKAQSNEQNDLQLQMAIGYLMHNLQNE